MDKGQKREAVSGAPEAAEKEEPVKKILLMLALKLAAKKLEGKKTYIIAIGQILWGLACAVSCMYPELSFLPENDPEKAVGIILGGFGALSGLGSVTQRQAIKKIKQPEAAEPQPPPVERPIGRGKYINPGHGVK